MNESTEVDLSSNNLSSILDSFYSGTTTSESSKDQPLNSSGDLNLEKLIQINEQEELKQLNYNDKVMSNLTNNFDIFYSIKSLLSEVSEELESCISSISSTKDIISSIEQDKEKIDDSLKAEKTIFEKQCKETIYLEKVYEIEKLEQIVSLGITIDSFNYLITMFDEAYTNLNFIKYNSETNNENKEQYKKSILSIQHSFNTIKDKVCELVVKERWRSQKQTELLIKTSLQLLGLNYTNKLIILNCVNYLRPFFNELFKTFKEKLSTYSTDIKRTSIVNFTESIFTFNTIKNINICYKPFNMLKQLALQNEELNDEDVMFNEEFIYIEHCSFNNENNRNDEIDDKKREDIIKEICVFYSNCINHLNVNIFKTNPLIIFKQFIDVSKNLSKEIDLNERVTLIEFANLVQLTIKNCIKSIITSWNIEINVNSEYFLKMDLFDLKEKLKAEMLQNIVFLNNVIKDCTEAFEINGLDDLIFTYIDNYIKDLILNIFKEWALLNDDVLLNNITPDIENKEILNLLELKIKEKTFKYFISKIYIEEIIFFNVIEFQSLFKNNIEYYNQGLKRIQNDIYIELEKYNKVEHLVLAIFIIRSMVEYKDALIGYKVLNKYMFRNKPIKYINDENCDRAGKEDLIRLDCKHVFDKCINVIKLVNYILKHLNNKNSEKFNKENIKEINLEKIYKDVLRNLDDEFIDKFDLVLKQEIFKTMGILNELN